MEALQLHAVYKKLYNSHENPYQYYEPRENPYQVLQVTCAAFEHCNEIKGLYDKIIIVYHSTKLYLKKYHLYAAHS